MSVHPSFLSFLLQLYHFFPVFFCRFVMDFLACVGLTFEYKYVRFFMDKGCDEDISSGKIPREGATLVQGFCKTAVCDTTSEPWGRNALPGAPVKAPMSDGC
jgi:hypothetical protein